MNKSVSFSAFLLLCLLMVSCSKGITLKELGEMSPVERQALTEVYLNVDLPDDAELNFWLTFDGCSNLTDVEIDPGFKGKITGTPRGGNSPEHLKRIVAKGATYVGYSTFYAGWDYGSFNTEIEVFEMPNLQDMGLHALGGGKNFTRRYSQNWHTNKVKELDFKELKGISGMNISGCGNLTTLKLGQNGPISFFTDFADWVDCSKIDLYIGKYEYENHVKGNVFYPHVYSNSVKGDGDITLGELVPESGQPSGEPIEFHSIQPY